MGVAGARLPGRRHRRAASGASSPTGLDLQVRFGAKVVSLAAMLKRPGGALSSRPLHFFWVADCSGSMARDGKIQALNHAAREALPHMRQVATGNPHARSLVRVLRFGTGAQWQTDEPVPIERFTWSDLGAGGVTDLGRALEMLAETLESPAMPERALPAVVVLVSDGQPTDDFDAGLAALESAPRGAASIRLAIAIGRDADRAVLRRFVGDPAVPLLDANTPEALVRQVRWASTIGLASSSSPRVATAAEPEPTVTILGTGLGADRGQALGSLSGSDQPGGGPEAGGTPPPKTDEGVGVETVEIW